MARARALVGLVGEHETRRGVVWRLEAEAVEMSRTSTLTMIVVLWVVLYM